MSPDSIAKITEALAGQAQTEALADETAPIVREGRRGEMWNLFHRASVAAAQTHIIYTFPVSLFVNPCHFLAAF